MTDLPGAVRHCLTRLADFGGRDTRSQFWFYILALFLAQQAVTAIALFGMMIGPLGRFGDADPAATFSFFRSFMLVMMAVPVLVIALVAAAVTRRLHDSGLRGWWGLMPMPFLAYGTYCMSRLFSSFGRPGEEPDHQLFAWAFLNNLIYLLTLVALIVLLVRGSEPGANRFGPPPAGMMPQ